VSNEAKAMRKDAVNGFSSLFVEAQEMAMYAQGQILCISLNIVSSIISFEAGPPLSCATL
jgi:hypothetical protein